MPYAERGEQHGKKIPHERATVRRRPRRPGLAARSFTCSCEWAMDAISALAHGLRRRGSRTVPPINTIPQAGRATASGDSGRAFGGRGLLEARCRSVR